jgi:hypothetical protein
VHAIPHIPQFIASVCVSTHAPPHTTPPLGQAHFPPSHAIPAGQAAPHAPQFIASVCVSTHAAPHWFAAGHAHAPLVH